MAMHEIRVLVAERSTMNIYIKGEDIEIEQNYIGILLEGFLKTRNQNLITPPVVLLPSNADLSLFGLESSGFQAVLILLIYFRKIKRKTKDSKCFHACSREPCRLLSYCTQLPSGG